jgi:hypothetical protein
MLSIFKSVFDWVQSGPVDFNVVTGEWSFKKETAMGEHVPPLINQCKRLRMHPETNSETRNARRALIGFAVFFLFLLTVVFWAAFTHPS